MNFTDIFIKRPVLATVISLLILLMGLRAIFSMQVRQYPRMENTVITVTTPYPGANAENIQGFVTAPLQKSIAGADGIDYITSSSTQGTSIIQAYIKLNFDPDVAFTNINSKVAAVRSLLPRDIEDPVVQKEIGSTVALMYIGFNSTQMTPGQIADYLLRVVQPKLQTIAGVSEAKILGNNTFAMRIWLDPQKMAARNVLASDVADALRNNNFQSAPGKTKGEFVAFNIKADTDLKTADQFKQLIIRNNGDSLIKLGDVARVELGAESYDSSVIFDGKKAVFMSVNSTPTANPLSVINEVRKNFTELQKNFPASLHAGIVYDATNYIRASIEEVIKTIFEATAIVIVVIFLFIGSLRSVIIPVVTIPLSLIGVCSLMLFLGYSINLLTLLAMVLGIGLVVDDAIVVVENIHRHIEEGMRPFDAAIRGAREIATPVISMTITLAAVYAPIGFMSGLTGALFKEFAFTLASAVVVSGVIALTLSPMMCSKILLPHEKVEKNRFVEKLEAFFIKLKNGYKRKLHQSLNYRPVTALFAIVVLLSCYFLYAGTTKELAPEEDQSVLFVLSTAPQYANIDYMTKYTSEFNKIFESFPETRNYFIVNGEDSPNISFAGAILKPWNERKRSQKELTPLLQAKMDNVPGLQIAVFPLPPLPVSGDSLPVQFIINSTTNFPNVYEASENIRNAAKKSGLFMFLFNSLRYDQPQIDIEINREKAAQIGLNMQDIGEALAVAMGENYINLFSVQGQSYKVIPQVERDFRSNPYNILDNYVKTTNGDFVPLSTVVKINYSVQPNALTQFQQLNAATLSGMIMPGHTLGEGLQFLQEEADKNLPHGMTYDFGGQSRQFIQEGSALIFTFFFAVIVIFLVLAAQFESLRDPLIVLISVPMSICGALIPLYLGLATINIYTQIGLITLVGLISKHGILMTDFANKLQIQEGLDPREAIERAASIRLRPILMTTAAMVVGVFPLIFASGAGAQSRFDIGLVVATGMTIGTLFTLFVVPTMYMFFSKVRAPDTQIFKPESENKPPKKPRKKSL